MSFVAAGLCLRLFLNSTVRPFLVERLDQRIAQAIAERRAMLMNQVSSRRNRDLIAAKQWLLRLARLNGEKGDTIAGEMRKLAQDAWHAALDG